MIMAKKWFFIKDFMSGAMTSNTNSYPIFCTEKELPEKIKEKEDTFFKLIKRTVFELTEVGEQKKLYEEPAQ
ncbi:hypothetical protein IT402_02215 [Candidatus Nomurabacteria bacterium]|nr:hypothetical protein [Candidatus Nomurabacteria bacterium]